MSIIILNWNGWKDTIECLESLYQINYTNYDVIVVDNASTDNSIQKIKEYCKGKIKVESKFFRYYPSNKPIYIFYLKENKYNKFNLKYYNKINSNRRLIIIENPHNYGFSKGNNIGIRFSLNILNSEYIIILNNDTVVDKNFINEFIKISKKDKNIGIIGPKILFYNKPNMINSAGVKINWLCGLGINVGAGKKDIYKYNITKEVDAIFGACMFIRKNVFRDIGYFDENFFILLEETDFCIRAKYRNYKIIYHPKAIIYHKGSISRKKIHEKSIYYSHRNRILLLKKHKKLNYTNLSCIALTHLASQLYYLIMYGKKYAKILFNAYVDGFSR